jgi:uncharacterized protein YodC (DUF2158 family)
MPEFSPGDVVVLRCGSPRMVITEADKPREEPPKGAGWGYGYPDDYRPGHWWCVWTVQGAVRRDRFPTAALRTVPPAAEAPIDEPNPRLRAVKGGA